MATLDSLCVEIENIKQSPGSQDEASPVSPDKIVHEMRKFEQQKYFHNITISSCIIGPILLISSFVAASYSNGKNIRCCSISTGIAYYKSSEYVYYIVVISTIISTLLSIFVSICRQIQIDVEFKEYVNSLDPKIMTKISCLIIIYINNIAVFFNVTGYLSLILGVILDSHRYNQPFIWHTLFSTYSVISTLTFLGLTMIITFIQRYIESQQNLKETAFYTDAVLLLFLYLIAQILWIIYAYEYFQSQDGVSVSDLGNVSEWIGFFSMVLGIMVLSLSFHHDTVCDEIVIFWEKICLPRKKK